MCITTNTKCQVLAFPDQLQVQVEVIMGFAMQHKFPVNTDFNHGVGFAGITFYLSYDRS